MTSKVVATLIAAALVALTLMGCASTLRHPHTGQEATCKSGFAIGGGTGIAGLVFVGVSAAFNVWHAVEYQACIDRLKAAGFEETTPPAAPAEPAPDAPVVRP